MGKAAGSSRAAFSASLPHPPLVEGTPLRGRAPHGAFASRQEDGWEKVGATARAASRVQRKSAEPPP